MCQYPLHSHPIAEHAKSIYASWDRLRIKPPEGYASWMDYWQVKYGKEKENDSQAVR